MSGYYSGMPGRFARAVAIVLLFGACNGGGEDNFVRGHGLKVASLSTDARARVYAAALDAAFEMGDPALTLMLDRRVLPRAGGMASDERLPQAVDSALRARNVVQGVCEPPSTSSKKTPQCTARGPGYIVRFSDVLRRGGDSVEVYLAVQKFDTPTSGASESLRFEKAYQVVKQGDSWRAAREARVHANEPTSGPGRR